MEHALYWAVLTGEKSPNRLTDWEKAIVLSYANREINSHAKDFPAFVEANPGTTVDYWAEKNTNYNDALYVRAIVMNPPNITRDGLALYCFYLDYPVTTKNCDQIAKKYGFSGEKLRQRYNYYMRYENRTTASNRISREKMIERLEGVIKSLPENKREKALKELKDLEDSQ